MNYTGAGIVVAVVDEGLNTNHPELRENYVSVSKNLRCSLQLLLHVCVRKTNQALFVYSICVCVYYRKEKKRKKIFSYTLLS